MLLSDLYEGMVLELTGPHTGWIQPAGGSGRIRFRQGRLRAAVLSSNLEPQVGSKATKHGQTPLKAGEEVLFSYGVDDYQRERAHVIVRVSDAKLIMALSEAKRGEASS